MYFMKPRIKITPTKKSRLDKLDFNHIPFGHVFSDHMFVCDYKNGKWRNPRVVPYSKISFAPSLAALHYGQSFFEGMKATKLQDGTPVLLRTEMHSKRINASAHRMSMPEFPKDLFQEALHTLVGLDADWIPTKPGDALYIRPFMFATDEYVGVRPSNTYKFIIFTNPVSLYYNKPIRLWAEEKYSRAANGGTGEAKCAGNYGGAYYPTALAQKNGYDQVMWLDPNEHKYVQEAGTMNLMFVIDGKIVTPNLDGSILHGITRDSLIQVFKKQGYTVEERPISVDEIFEAHKKGTLQEAFGCGTAAVITPVQSITYRNSEITIPIVKNGISESAKKFINDLRNGNVEDTFGWLEPVKVMELV